MININKKFSLKIKIIIVFKLFFLILTFYFLYYINKKKNQLSFQSQNKNLFINTFNKFIMSKSKLKKNDNKTNLLNSLDIIIYRLNKDINIRKPKYILLFDLFTSKYCADLNSFLIFQYYQQRNISDAYYIINNESELYNSLLKQNKTQNLIPVNKVGNSLWSILYPYLLNSKIIVQSYIFSYFHKLINNVSYLNYLKINHGIRYFKRLRISEFSILNKNKINTIISSPYEYSLIKKEYHLDDNQMYKAGLPRFDRFQNIKKNKYEKKCKNLQLSQI